MIYAFWYLSNRKIVFSPTSHSYEVAKKQLIDTVKDRKDSAVTRSKKSRPGKLNGMYGKTHSANIREKLSKNTREKLANRSYEELHGEEKSNRLKLDRSIKLKEYIKQNPGVRTGKNNGNAKEYVITTPLGEEIFTISLKTFCRENGISYSSMGNVVRGNKLEYKGWKIRYS